MKNVSTDDLQRQLALSVLELAPRLLSVAQRIFVALIAAAFGVGVFFATTQATLSSLGSTVAKIEGKLEAGVLPVTAAELRGHERRLEHLEGLRGGAGTTPRKKTTP